MKIKKLVDLISFIVVMIWFFVAIGVLGYAVAEEKIWSFFWGCVCIASALTAIFIRGHLEDIKSFLGRKIIEVGSFFPSKIYLRRTK